MSYGDLAARIETLAAKLRSHAGDLEGAKLAKAAQSFSKAAATFERHVETAISGSSPDLKELEILLASPAKKLLKAPFWDKALRSLHGVREEKPTAAKFLKLVRAEGNAGEALALVRREVEAQSVPVKPVPKDKAELQAELWRLGGLTDEEFAAEAAKRWKAAGLKKLAKANAIAVPKEVTLDRLARIVLETARRAHGNVHS